MAVSNGIGQADVGLNQQYSPGPQPIQNTNFGTPVYYTDPSQISPIQHYPYPPTGITSRTGIQNATGRAVTDFANQLIPTSQNVRNQNLSELLNRMNTPMESLFASQGSDQLAQQYGGASGSLMSNLASRGLIGSGAQASGLRGLKMNFLSGMASNQIGARNEENKRQLGLSQQLFNTVNSDLDYYRYINAGRDTALGRAAPVNIGALSGLARGTAGIVAALFGGGNNDRTPNFNGGSDRVGLGAGLNLGYGGGTLSDAGNGQFTDEFDTRYGR